MVHKECITASESKKFKVGRLFYFALKHGYQLLGFVELVLCTAATRNVQLELDVCIVGGGDDCFIANRKNLT